MFPLQALEEINENVTKIGTGHTAHPRQFIVQLMLGERPGRIKRYSLLRNDHNVLGTTNG
jgi:hypothetical protein